MKHLALWVALSISIAACGKKDADRTPEPTAVTTPEPAPTDKGAAPKPVAAKVDLPPECVELTAALDKLAACDKLAGGRDKMKEGYQRMLKAMADLGDKKAMVEGCQQGLDGLLQSLKTVGC